MLTSLSHQPRASLQQCRPSLSLSRSVSTLVRKEDTGGSWRDPLASEIFLLVVENKTTCILVVMEFKQTSCDTTIFQKFGDIQTCIYCVFMECEIYFGDVWTRCGENDKISLKASSLT